MRIIDLTAKNVEKIGFQVGFGSTIPGSGSADPVPDQDPHQNEAEPMHCIKHIIHIVHVHTSK